MNPTWQVNLFVNGPITVNRIIPLYEPKVIRAKDPFYSNIELRSLGAAGVQATVTAYASDRGLAREAALHFFGQTLDALALQIRQPLGLSFQNENPHSLTRYGERRIVEREEWQQAFREARLLAFAEPTFLRAMGWYRKGLVEEDPFYKFLAFWNSLETVAGKYHPKTERAKNGSKSQLWECFKQIWSDDVNTWPIIAGDSKWIDENYEVRKDIAHGVTPVTIESIKQVSEKLEAVEAVAYTFLTDWHRKQLNPTVPEELAHLFHEPSPTRNQTS